MGAPVRPAPRPTGAAARLLDWALPARPQRMLAVALTPLQLQALVGRRARYQGRSLVVLEVLPETPAVVLAEPAAQRPIQANQFGEVGRRAPATWTIPVYQPDGSYHPLFRELGLV